MTHTGLAVIESRWWSQGNDTVRPLFETLAGIVENNPHSVRYDMFVEEASLSQIISDVADKDYLHFVYIGAHGDDALSVALAMRKFRGRSLETCSAEQIPRRQLSWFSRYHSAIYVNRLQGWNWEPANKEKIDQVAEIGSLLSCIRTINSLQKQQEKERVVLSREGSSDSAQALAGVIKSARWDVACAVLCGAIDTLGHNLMEVWDGPEAHEQRIYQMLMLCLRIDNTIGALLLHQLAMAHHQRGWAWRPSPDEFRAVAEIAARYLIEKRYNAAALVPSPS